MLIARQKPVKEAKLNPSLGWFLVLKQSLLVSSTVYVPQLRGSNRRTVAVGYLLYILIQIEKLNFISGG
jgi:hypothetical protein